MPVPFNRINFGSAAAENEVELDRNLLLEGYLDLHSAFEGCLNAQNFLVLGRKGSGKSALGQHLLLTAATRKVSARVVDLSDLPFSDFPGLLREKETSQTGYASIWRFHLLLQLLDSVRTEAGARVPDPLGSIILALEAVGALPAPTLPSAIHQSRAFSDGLSARIPDAHVHLSLYDLVQRMSAALASVDTKTRHILVVDGLDEVLDPTAEDFVVLNALIKAASTLNRSLSEEAKRLARSPAKIIVLCRTDLFERFPGANTAKYLEDSSVELTWFDRTMEPAKSQLVKLLNQKARVSDPSIVDVVTTYFPPKMDQGRPTIQMLLDNTRHTPRDFLRIFRHIKKFDDSTRGERLSYQAIRQGLRSYSRWFTSEVRNELSGYAPEEEINEVINLLRRQGKANFYMADLEEFQRRDDSTLDALPLMNRLFECGAVGMIERDKTYQNGSPRVSFKFRNPTATFNAAAQVSLNHGWRRDLSTPYENFDGAPPRTHTPRDKPTRRRRTIRVAGQEQLFEITDPTMLSSPDSSKSDGQADAEAGFVPTGTDRSPKDAVLPVAEPTRLAPPRGRRGGRKATRMQGPPLTPAPHEPTTPAGSVDS